MHFEADLNTDQVSIQLNDNQLSGIMAFKDKLDVWKKHNKYSDLRPQGWRSDPECRVSARYSCYLSFLAVTGIRSKASSILHVLTGRATKKYVCMQAPLAIRN